MATTKGKDGVVKVGASPSQVAEVKEWSLDQSVDLAEDTVQGDEWKSFGATFKEWGGSMTTLWDFSDTNGQEACDVGTELDVELYPSGEDASDKYYSGSVIVESISIGVPKDDYVERVITFKGNGALTEATVSA